MKKICLSLILLTASTLAIAEPGIKYVSDQLVITMRSGAGNEFKIVRTLPTGTRLTVLEESEDKRYSRVKTDKDVEGWVLNQYLLDTPAAKTLLKEANTKLARLEKENSKLNSELSTLKKESSGTSSQLGSTQEERDKLQAEVEKLRKVAAKPIQLEEENGKLKEQMIALKNQLRISEEKSQALEDSDERLWFATGAAVLFFGIILGLIAPKLRSRKQGLWNEL